MRGPVLTPIMNRQCPMFMGSAVPPTETGDCLQSLSLPQNCVHTPLLPPPGNRHCAVHTQLSLSLPSAVHIAPTGSAPAARQTLCVSSRKTHFSSAGQGLCVVVSQST